MCLPLTCHFFKETATIYAGREKLILQYYLPSLWAPIAIQAFMYVQKWDMGKLLLLHSLPLFSG